MAVTWDATNPANSANLVSQVIKNNWEAIQQMAWVNLLEDPLAENWCFGDSSRPAFWSGAVAPNTWARTTGSKIAGTNGNNFIRAGITNTNQRIAQSVVSSTDFPDTLQGAYYGIGAWVRSSSATDRISIWDGVGRSIVTSTHTGGGAWEWLSAAGQIDASASELRWDYEPLTTSGNHDICGMTLVEGPIPPNGFVTPNMNIFSLPFTKEGGVGTAQELFTFSHWRPFMIRGAAGSLRVSPTTDSVVVDVNVDRSGTNQSVFVNRPTIAVGEFIKAQDADTATYQRKCVYQINGGDVTESDAMGTVALDVPDSGSGADLTITVHCATTMSPYSVYRSEGHQWDL